MKATTQKASNLNVRIVSVIGSWRGSLNADPSPRCDGHVVARSERLSHVPDYFQLIAMPKKTEGIMPGAVCMSGAFVVHNVP
jgi:hypothetical protein